MYKTLYLESFRVSKFSRIVKFHSVVTLVIMEELTCFSLRVKYSSCLPLLHL